MPVIRSKKPNLKTILTIGFFILLLVGMGVSLALVSLNQDTRQQAAGFTYFPTPTPGVVGVCTEEGKEQCWRNGVYKCQNGLLVEQSTCASGYICESYDGILGDNYSCTLDDMQPPSPCTVGHPRCAPDGSGIEVCNKTGGWITSETCPAGQSCYKIRSSQTFGGGHRYLCQ